ncbi:uncharacterized protein LOC135491594 [Lineus longissimus]|uniref:uncharacterized protein LOC135491594 n=1 Tax=Lineus longissimus TaxID=88925 RepID=UPI00315CEB30
MGRTRTQNSYSEYVINLSDVTLTPSQTSLLSKGLNFCPTPGEPDFGELFKDLDKFHVSLRRRAFFHSDDPDSDPPTPGNVNSLEQKLELTSKWNPPGPPDLEAFIRTNEFQFDRIPIRAPHTQNLTENEKAAISQLQKLSQIVIKPADKGSAIVIMNKTDYIAEAERQLKNLTHYRSIPEESTPLHATQVTSFLTDMLNTGEITEKMYAYLDPCKPRTPQFYLLPKIHKGITPPPGRPIMSANGCPTERISQLADHFLQPLVKMTKSYIKDTTHFLQLINSLGPLPPDALLVTLDVTSLYTNNPTEEGKRAVARHLVRHRPGGHNVIGPTNQSIIRLLDLVLTKNNFQFINQNYLQISGTAMGTKVAPSFANLFMADFEDRYVYNQPIKPHFWGRFIDDIFAIFTHTREQVDGFVNTLNSQHPTIKFTAEISDSSVNFLDTTVNLLPTGELYTDLYVNPTDSHNYLLYSSAHVASCKQGIPYGQFLRVRRICSRLEDFEHHSLILAQHFARRGYPNQLIEESLIKAHRQNRAALITAQPNTPTEEEAQPPFFFVTTYNPAQTEPYKIISENKDILARHRTTLHLFECPITQGFRRPPNLRDLLVRAKLDNLTSTTTKTNQLICLSPSRCRYCPRLDTTGRITSRTTGRSYRTKNNICCQSNNVIYCIQCITCNKQYVGETKQTIIGRFQKHFYNITKHNHAEIIGYHFDQTDHHGLDDVRIFVLEFIHASPDADNSKNIRPAKESTWIHRLRTMSLLGLNIKDNTSW